MPETTKNIISYYTEAGLDYEYWSKHFNMHFGYYGGGMNPFDLEGMLRRMNQEVLGNLELASGSPHRILDLGCGVGATLREAFSMMKDLLAVGVTIVPRQAERAMRLGRTDRRYEQLHIVQGDFSALPFADRSFDGVYALESSCYAPGLGKECLVREMYRVLKPGGRFVVADAFLKTRRKMSWVTRTCYRALCDYWALETLGEIDEFRSALEAVGFQNIQIRNISKNVTPSVLHIPAVLARFLCREIILGEGVNPLRWKNMMAGPLLIGFTLDRSRSGYFLIKGRR